ncbi:MAG TPA: hypothetical protein VHZ28_01145 [Terracidiphilus sp.]|nr:hypothetical protein [Terracidiphilus sp.]
MLPGNRRGGVSLLCARRRLRLSGPIALATQTNGVGFGDCSGLGARSTAERGTDDRSWQQEESVPIACAPQSGIMPRQQSWGAGDSAQANTGAAAHRAITASTNIAQIRRKPIVYA